MSMNTSCRPIKTILVAAALAAATFISLSAASVQELASPYRAEIYGPVIPVIADRPYNVLSEICIEADEPGKNRITAIDLTINGINRDAVRNVKAMYSGTMSVILSRTQSFVMKDVTKKLGGGQEIWCDPDFVMEAASLDPNSSTVPGPASTAPNPSILAPGPASSAPGRGVRGTGSGPDFWSISLHPDQPLTNGKNYLYISMEIDPHKVSDFSRPFTLDVTGVSIDGRSVALTHQGTIEHHLGSKVRQHGEDGVDAYRIPGLVTTNAGTLISVYDIRYDSSLDLQSNVDIGVSRSTDGGRTWEDMIVAMDMGTWGNLPQGQNGIGDPAILVDEQTGDLFIVAVWTHGISADRAWTAVGQGMTPYETAQLMMVRSSDDGKTWSEPFNVTSQIKDPEWYLTLQGPGRGICMEDGTLVFALQHIGRDRIPCAGIMYSKDHGKTWQRHEYAKSNTTEAQVAEVDPGVLMLNMRDNRKTGRAVFITDDLGRTWREHPSSGSLIEPVCMASLLKVPAAENCYGRDLLIFSNPATTKGRHSTTIKVSLDKGYTWLDANSLMIDHENNWGYSCLTMVDEKTVGILYECSTAHLVFQAIRLQDIIHDLDTTPDLQHLPAAADPQALSHGKGVRSAGTGAGPVSTGYDKGVSAPFCGVVSDLLVMAGGANFPNLPAAENGTKVFYDDILVLPLHHDKPAPSLSPSSSQEGVFYKIGHLPEPSAYGASFKTRNGLLLAGGSNGHSTLSTVCLLTSDLLSLPDAGKGIVALPDLPEPIEQAGSALSGNQLYLAGGLSNGSLVHSVYSCNAASSDRTWKKIAELPEPSVQPVIFVEGRHLYYWCGFNPETGSAEGKGWKLNLRSGEWTAIAPVPGNGKTCGTMTGASPFYQTDGTFVIIGGTDREMFEKGLQATGEARGYYMNLPPSHYGFQKCMRIYDVKTDSWTTSRPSGKTAVAGAGTVHYKGTSYLLGGEIKPGVRTPENWKMKLK